MHASQEHDAVTALSPLLTVSSEAVREVGQGRSHMRWEEGEVGQGRSHMRWEEGEEGEEKDVEGTEPHPYATTDH